VRYILALALLAAGVPAQQVAANESLAAVKGVVTNAVTGERLRKAFVRLQPASGNSRPATTDEQGRFSYENLKPGSYKLEAEHVGFIASLLSDAAGTSVELHLTTGETADVNVKLIPQAAINGRLLDSDGDPWVHGSIGVYRSVFRQGKRRLEGTGYDGGMLDDQGQFRLGQMAPGTYYLKGESDGGWEQFNRLPSEGQLLPSWYPGSLDFENATPIVLAAGQEITGLEIRLRRSATYRIRGMVSGLDTLPKTSPQGARIGRMVWASPVSGVGSSNHNVDLRADGTFELQGLPPGEYDVDLHQGPVELGHVTVRVDDHDVDGAVIEATPAHGLKGSVRFEGNEAGQIAGLPFILRGLDSGASQISRTREDGAFDFPLVSAGRYWLFGPDEAKYYVKTLRYDGKESRNGVITIANGDGPLELVLSARGARIVADVKRGDAVAPVLAARVVLVPDTERSTERAFGTRPAVRDQNGVYSIGNIAAGAYRLFAFESVPEEAWVDAEFWKEIRSKGADLHISEGESRNAEVPLVTRPEIAPLLSRLGME